MQQVCKAPGFGRGVFLDLRLKNNSRTSGQTVRATEGGNVRARGYRKLMELQVPKCDSFQANKFAVCICSWVSLKMRKSSLHMQDATQCIKKRHRAVFSDNLRQLEKKKINAYETPLRAFASLVSPIFLLVRRRPINKI